MLGIAGDVYWKELEMQAPERDESAEHRPAYSHNISSR